MGVTAAYANFYFDITYLSDPNLIITLPCLSLSSKLDWCDSGMQKCQLKTCWCRLRAQRVWRQQRRAGVQQRRLRLWGQRGGGRGRSPGPGAGRGGCKDLGVLHLLDSRTVFLKEKVILLFKIPSDHLEICNPVIYDVREIFFDEPNKNEKARKKN